MKEVEAMLPVPAQRTVLVDVREPWEYNQVGIQFYVIFLC